jgi:hypothetical protein
VSLGEQLDNAAINADVAREIRQIDREHRAEIAERDATILSLRLKLEEREWQDISTAPKGEPGSPGRLIDIWIADPGVRWSECHYDAICDDWRTSRPSGRLVTVRAKAVTHWRECPAPPQIMEEGK